MEIAEKADPQILQTHRSLPLSDLLNLGTLLAGACSRKHSSPPPPRSKREKAGFSSSLGYDSRVSCKSTVAQEGFCGKTYRVPKCLGAGIYLRAQAQPGVREGGGRTLALGFPSARAWRAPQDQKVWARRGRGLARRVVHSPSLRIFPHWTDESSGERGDGF